jgi:hypothetical protein
VLYILILILKILIFFNKTFKKQKVNHIISNYKTHYKNLYKSVNLALVLNSKEEYK